MKGYVDRRTGGNSDWLRWAGTERSTESSPQPMTTTLSGSSAFLEGASTNEEDDDDGASRLRVLEDEFVRYLSDVEADKLETDWDSCLDEDVMAEELIQKRSHRLLDQVDRAFEGTIYGKIRSALNSLASVFVVFAFNGQRFDFVVIGADIVVYFKSQGQQVRMTRDGLSVKGISVTGNLHFREASLLLSPGTSLDGLGKLVGLEIKKFRYGVGGE